jgi:deazaflavin-dependent oxidoreductase (nitroreductase family)
VDFDEMNRQVIEEFRANDGLVDTAVGGYFKGKPILLLHTTGARTRRLHMVPLMFLDEDERRYVFASKGGAPRHPDWFHNLRAHPEVTVEVGIDSYPARATEITGAERDRVYAEMVRAFPQFDEYQQKTARTIPVMQLEPA